MKAVPWALAGAIIIAVSGCERSSEGIRSYGGEAPAVPADAAPLAADASAIATSATPAAPIAVPTGQLTRSDFAGLVSGRTKAEIRQASGPPSNVVTFGGVGSWFYHADTLPIVDPEAGVVLSSVGIDFDSSGRATGLVGN